MEIAPSCTELIRSTSRLVCQVCAVTTAATSTSQHEQARAKHMYVKVEFNFLGPNVLDFGLTVRWRRAVEKPEDEYEEQDAGCCAACFAFLQGFM